MSLKNTTRRDFLKLAALGTVSTAVTGCGIEIDETAPRPNIVFIMADDMGVGDLGVSGQKMIETPKLDQMAAEGMHFTNAYSAHNVCRPARCSLMTGLHTGHALMRSNSMGWPLRRKDFTVAELLKQAEYTTAMFGKWALSGHLEKGGDDSSGIPTRQGFDEFVGYLGQSRAQDYYPTWLWDGEQKIQIPQNEKDDVIYAPDFLVDRAIEFISRQDPNQPFFLYLPFTLPHRGASSTQDTNYPLPSIDEQYIDLLWPDWAKRYASMVSRIDDHVGLLLDALKAQGLDDNTIVFVTSDNGSRPDHDEFFGSNLGLRGGKSDFYEGGIKIPMVVRWPGHVQAGQISDFVWAFWDFMATAAALAGVAPPKDTDGQSIVPTLLGQSQQGTDYLYWEEVIAPSAQPMVLINQAIRKEDWKLYNNLEMGVIDLFNLADDPMETVDLADIETTIVRQLLELMDEAHEPWIEMEEYRR